VLACACLPRPRTDRFPRASADPPVARRRRAASELHGGLAMNEKSSRMGKRHSHRSKDESSGRRSTNSARGNATGASNDLTASERALWKGVVAFGLVQFPVSIATAETAHELEFHQLDRRDNAPVGYERVNKVTGKKVPWGDIVKGYEISKGEYVIVTDEDFRSANVAASQTIDIQDFVETSEIAPAYFERPYHLMPEGKSAKAYAVLRNAMAHKRLVGIGLVVIRTRQHLCAVVPRGEGLDLEILRFEHELRQPARTVASSKVTPKEIQLAEQLIDQMVSRWEPGKYKDTYRDELLSAIHKKARSGVVEPRNVPAALPPVTDLVALLQKSMKKTAKSPPRRKAATKHRAA
jgi:DNA end-binding protein Ku